MGRGGAAFPTGRKWAAVAAQAAQPHYLVCNADESEPGTFKDRVLLEGDPFATVEAMTIAAYATGASKGYLYIRGEYPEAEARVANAIDRAREAGLLGDDILGSGFAFDIELRRGAGAYICGEETALFESIEGKRGEPRNKPPFPVEVGLFGKPTVVNNVETLANVLRIVTDGGEAFARIGTEGSTGPKLFCLSGPRRATGRLRGRVRGDAGRPDRDGRRRAGRTRDPDDPARWRGRGLRRAERARHAAHLRGDPGGRRHARLGRDHGLRRDGRPGRYPAPHRPVLPRRVVRPVRPVPGRDGPPGGAARPPRRRLADAHPGRGGRAPARDRPGDARRIDLRTRPDRIVGDRVCPAPPGYGGAVSDGLSMDRDPAPDARTPHAGQDSAAQPLTDILLTPPARASKPPTAPVVEAPPAVSLTIDGAEVTVPAGTTILGACRTQGIDTPTLCYAENLTPVNVCRVCVVEVTGSRVLVPACSRPVEAGMDVQTDSERVRLSRKMVLEFLGSSVDLSLAGPIAPDGSIAAYAERYGADANRFGPPAAPAMAGERDTLDAGHHHAPAGDAMAATVAQPTKVDNNLYVRDYAKCILCYKCVDACGEEAQNTFAIAVAGRGFDARISTEQAVPLPESACVYCGNCIGVCPTGALMFKSEYDMREAGTWDESAQTVTETICPYCGVGCAVELHAQDDRIVKVTSPTDSSVTEGHLCIKGRFGFEFVNNRPTGPRP